MSELQFVNHDECRPVPGQVSAVLVLRERRTDAQVAAGMEDLRRAG